MRYLALIPLLCVGAMTFCLTAFRVDADSPKPENAPAPAAVQAEATTTIEAERAIRASHRAFYTAPPVIPHDIYPSSAGDCLTCHSEERQYFGKISPRTPHPDWVNCTQCHLPAKSVFKHFESAGVDTTWKGLETPTDGTRAHVVAPPTMPHRKFLRENCQSCHSPKSPFESMRGPHPERMNCAQCHMAVSDNEFHIEKSSVLPAR